MLTERIDDKITNRVNNVLGKALTEKRIVGAVARVARDGHLVANLAVGLKDRESSIPMREDTLFRLASLTKPVTAVVTLGLVERGVLSLDDHVTRWLPDFVRSSKTDERRPSPFVICSRTRAGSVTDFSSRRMLRTIRRTSRMVSTSRVFPSKKICEGSRACR